ncbi:MAG: hypothetical protein R3C11_10140 [Planctomycetaceae bacterium]
MPSSGSCIRLCLSGLLLMLTTLPLAVAQEKQDPPPTPVEQLLNKQTFDANLPLLEVKEFNRGRIMPFPEIEDLAAWEEYREHLREEILTNVVYKGDAAPGVISKDRWSGSIRLKGARNIKYRNCVLKFFPGCGSPP